MHDRQAVHDLDGVPRSVGGAAAAGVARRAAAAQRRLAFERRVALDEDLLGLRNQHEEIQRTHLDAVAAGGAGLRVHRGQGVVVHVEGVEGADSLAVAQAEAAPGAAEAAAIDHGRRVAGAHALVPGEGAHVAETAGALEPGDALLLGSHSDAEKRSDLLEGARVGHRALARRRLGGEELPGEGRAAGLAAGTAVVPRQHLFHHLEPRVLLHPEEAVRHREQTGEEEPQPGHDGDRCRDFSHAVGP